MIWKHVGRATTEIYQRGLHGVRLAPPDGFLRGIDAIESELFRARLAKSARAYYRHHGHAPDLIAPATFTEKQVLFKFFAPVPLVPSPSDKLRSCGYAPREVRDKFSIPRRFGISASAKLPPNDALAPGTYYFKSNHGSGTNMRVTYPLEPETRQKLEAVADRWLNGGPHAPGLSVWWYEKFSRAVYLEEDLGAAGKDAPDWKFFVCNGRVELFQVDVDRSGDHRQTIYDRDGTHIDAMLYYLTGPRVEMPPELDRMVEVAEAIGRNFDFIRVDLYVRDGTIFLGEIGMVMNGATIRIHSPELDARLGAAWTAPWLGEIDSYAGAHYGSVVADVDEGSTPDALLSA